MLKAKCAALALCAALIFLYSFQTSALGAMRHGSDLEGGGPFRTELCEVCHNGTPRPHTRRGELLDRQVCTHMPWNTHELYQMYDHYICIISATTAAWKNMLCRRENGGGARITKPIMGSCHKM